jgi:hypothetical protein
MYESRNKAFRNQAPIPYIAPQMYSDLLDLRRSKEMRKLREMNRNIAQKYTNQKYESPVKVEQIERLRPRVTYGEDDTRDESYDLNRVRSPSIESDLQSKSRKHRNTPKSVQERPMDPFTLYQPDPNYLVRSRAMIRNFSPRVFYSESMPIAESESIHSNNDRSDRRSLNPWRGDNGFEKMSSKRADAPFKVEWPYKYEQIRSPNRENMHLLQHTIIAHDVPASSASVNSFGQSPIYSDTSKYVD